MSLFDDIIDLLSSRNGSLTDALLKTKVLMHRIGHQELVGWVNDELNGYPTTKEVPSYRVTPARLVGNVSNGVHRYSDFELPTLHLAESGKNLRTHEIRQSIGALEALIPKEGTKTLVLPQRPEFTSFITKALTPGFHVESMWLQVESSQLVHCLTEVRSRLLDFVLGLQSSLGDVEEKNMKEAAKSVDAVGMFQGAVFGDNATVVLGDHNKTSIRNQVKKGDFDTLAKVLKEAGVGDEDVQHLQVAIAADPPVVVESKPAAFGPSVRDWMSRMMAKAVEASWSIELGIAGGLLTNALQSYYFG